MVALDYKNPYLSPYEEYQVRLLLQTAFLPNLNLQCRGVLAAVAAERETNHMLKYRL